MCNLMDANVCSYSLIYFLKMRSDALQGTEKFPADVDPFGNLNSIRSDNGSGFICRDFQSFL